MVMRRTFALALAGTWLVAAASAAAAAPAQQSAARAAPFSQMAPTSAAVVSALPWYTRMENGCRNIYANRGRPPQASSGNQDDQMALNAWWAANLQDKAVVWMNYVQHAAATNAAKQPVQLMGKIRDLNRETVPIYLQHPIVNQRLLYITLVELPQLEKNFSQTYGRTMPSCTAIAQL